MNVYRNKDELFVYIREADIEIKVYPHTTFADPEIERTWQGTYLFARVGEQAFHMTTTEFDHFVAYYDHVVARVLRAILAAERAARRDGVPQAVAYRGGPTPTAFYGPAAFRRPGEPWVEIAPDGIAVWHNEEL